VFTISVVLSGTRTTTRGTLANREIFVGRSRTCHLVLRDETVSGVHCRLVAITGGAIVLDEGSTNGTWLNDELVIQPTLMTVDDELRIGPFALRVQSLVGGTNATSLHVRPGRSRPIDRTLSFEIPPLAERPRANEPPTDPQVSQALVFWRILGFQEGASLEAARIAYLSLAEQYRPDKLAQLSPELREVGELKLQEIEFAWKYIQRLFRRSREVDAA
jgi:hypothetical protein